MVKSGKEIILLEWVSAEPDVIGATASVIGAAASVIVPILIAWIGFAVQSRGKRTEKQLADIQAAQFELNSRQRRDSLLSLLPEVSSVSHFKELRREALGYSGSDLELLLTALRLNPFEPLPTYRPSGKKITAKEAQDYVDSIPKRYTSKRQSESIEALIRFVNLCHCNLIKSDFESLHLGPVIAEVCRADRRIGHQKVREFITQGSWRLAPAFLYELDRLPSDGKSLNILAGTMLGIMDIEAKRIKLSHLMSGYPRPHNTKEFNNRVRLGIVYLLHGQRLRQVGQWDQKGFTDAITAPIAWLIRAIGYVAAGDEHVTMRIIQNLEPVIRSLDDLYWGVDEPTLVEGLTQIRHRCPGLWDSYGAGILEATRVRLTSIDEKNESPSPDS